MKKAFLFILSMALVVQLPAQDVPNLIPPSPEAASIVGYGNTGVNPMITRVLKHQPKFIATDGLIVYRSLIPGSLHVRDSYRITVKGRNKIRADIEQANGSAS